MEHGPDTIRLLPWTGSGGKPCYVIGDGNGYVSRMADDIENIQLGIAGDLLGARSRQEPAVAPRTRHR